MLSKPPVINGFVEILFNSVDTRVLRATVFLLSELGSRDNGVIETLTRVDSDVECVISLFKKGLVAAIVLIYLLRPSITTLVEMEMVDSLLDIITKNEDNDDSSIINMFIKPRTASVILLRQILQGADERSISEITKRIVSSKVIESIIGSLEAEWIEERIGAVSILLRSMMEDGKCRKIIADKAELCLVLESFLVVSSDEDRFKIVHFLYELLKLKRRMLNEQILHIIKDEGSFSTMHILLVYLQTVPQDQLPVVAGLLLQLDLLGKPRKASIYREEAIDVLISCLRNSEFPAIQIAAAETILSLQGRFSSYGKPIVRSVLLKRAGLEKNYRTLMRKEQRGSSSLTADIQETLAEEKAAEEWERKMAYVLVTHENGLLFEALAEGLKSRYAELCSASFVSTTWLVNMLSFLPDTGIKEAARICLLKRFVPIFNSAKDIEDRALSMLAINTFIRDAEGIEGVNVYMKDILKGLRELKKYSGLAFEMLKVLSEGNESSAEYWNHKELYQEDCSINGEVLSIVCFNDTILSGHSDGTIKVWSGKGGVNLNLIQETREHSKAVTSLVIVHSEERLYSGSLDRTVRAWSISNEVMHCEQVYDMKDHVNNLVVANSISCFIPQGSGIKVNSWNGESKLLNPNKNVKCLALVHEKLYCGCHDNSIQEIDLATGTLTTIQNSSRKLMGKGNHVNALQVYDGLVYSSSSSLDGAALKIWSRPASSKYDMIRSLPSTMEIRAILVSAELIYLGCKGGIVEIWCKKKLVKRETLQIASNGKVQCMALDANEEVLVIGTSNGIIQAWRLS